MVDDLQAFTGDILQRTQPTKKRKLNQFVATHTTIPSEAVKQTSNSSGTLKGLDLLDDNIPIKDIDSAMVQEKEIEAMPQSINLALHKATSFKDSKPVTSMLSGSSNRFNFASNQGLRKQVDPQKMQKNTYVPGKAATGQFMKNSILGQQKRLGFQKSK